MLIFELAPLAIPDLNSDGDSLEIQVLLEGIDKQAPAAFSERGGPRHKGCKGRGSCLNLCQVAHPLQIPACGTRASILGSHLQPGEATVCG